MNKAACTSRGRLQTECVWTLNHAQLTKLTMLKKLRKGMRLKEEAGDGKWRKFESFGSFVACSLAF